MDERAILKLIDGIYGAALEPERWVDALADVASAFGAVGADVYLLREEKLAFACIGGGVEEAMDDYLARFHGQTRRYRAVEALPEGGMVTDLEFISWNEMARSPFYEEFLRPLGVYHSLSAVTLKSSGEVGLLGIQLPVASGAPDRRQCRLLELLIPHFRRASQLHLRLAGARLRERQLRDCIDQLSLGVVLIGRRGEVELANSTAAAIFREGRGIEVQGRRLRCSDSPADRALTRAVAVAVDPGCSLADAGGLVPVPGDGSRACLSVLVTPLPRRRRDTEELAALAFISDPERPSRDALASVLSVTYGLTPTESSIAAGLLKGHDARALARMHGVTYDTVRTHIKRILEKAGVHRQAAFVARAAAGLLPLC